MSEDTPTRASRPRGSGLRALRTASDALHVRRAFGPPVQQGDVTLVPVASVVGGSGAGTGGGEAGREAGERTGYGSGGGFGVRVRPLGVYVVREGRVDWRPALDLGRVIAGGQVLAGVIALAVAFGRRRRP